MNSYQDAVSSDGAVVKVAVNVTTATIQKFRRGAHPIPQSIEVMALIDTGADVTVFDTAVLGPLHAFGLAVSRWLYVNAPALGSTTTIPEYLVGLTLPVGANPPLHLPAIPVVERALGATGYRALLGRDVLAHCGLYYDGPGRRFTLAF